MAKSRTTQTHTGNGTYRERHETKITTGGTFNGKTAKGVGGTAKDSQKAAKESRKKQGW